MAPAAQCSGALMLRASEFDCRMVLQFALPPTTCVIRIIHNKPDSFSEHDLHNIYDAVHLAVELLLQRGYKAGVEQVAAAAQGRSKLVLNPAWP